MDINDLVATLWWAVLFGLGVYVFVRMVRIVERPFPKLHKSWMWREVVLPALPAVAGGAFALMAVKYPFPEEIKQSTMARLMLGSLLGFTCAWMVRIINSYVKSRTGVDVSISEPPPP